MSRRFFIGSVGQPGQGYDEDNLERCVKYNCHTMHQDTKQKGVFEDVSKGDVCFLKYKDQLIAYGEVTKTSTEENINLDVWNWVIYVKEWVFFDKDNNDKGISNYGVSWDTIGGSQMATIKEVTKAFAMDKMRDIDKSYNLYKKILEEINLERNMQKTQHHINLLEESKNLIFTGAPGTGKTYLAKEIAKHMIGVENDEKLKDSDQLEFVQFHPSYDYTDFVEGLRPTKPDENGNMGFELKDGVFKRFCQIARKNFEDSQKPKDQLERELSLESYLSNFINHINEVIESDGKYPLIGVSGKSIAPIVEIDEKNFKTKAQSGNILSTALVNIIEKYESYVQERDIDWTFNVVQEKLKTTYHSSYFFAFVKAFDEYILNHQLEINDVKEVQLKPYIIIIDEINRGEISKIFGELFFSIDPSYRGVKGAVKTQYSNLHIDEREVFYIPENVYIIGTMNDIDRSVESFDFAMRRRFVWQEITAEESARNMNLSEQTTAKMNALNEAIAKITGLSDSYHIGGAYFLDKDGNERTDYDNLWQLRLEPLLKEYLRGIPQSDTYLDNLKLAFNQEYIGEDNGQ